MMVTRNHHNHGRSRTGGTTRQFFGLASLLDILARMGAGYIGGQERARIDALRAENLKLKNQIADTQQGVVSNRVVEGDLKIELLKLKVAREKYIQRVMGVDAPDFQASDYADPGNIREEERKRRA